MKNAYLLVWAANALGLLQRATRVLKEHDANVIAAVGQELFERSLFVGAVQFSASEAVVAKIRSGASKNLEGLHPVVLTLNGSQNGLTDGSETRFTLTCNSDDNIGLLDELLYALKLRDIDIASIDATTTYDSPFSGSPRFDVRAKLSMDGSVSEEYICSTFEGLWKAGGLFEVSIGWDDEDESESGAFSVISPAA